MGKYKIYIVAISACLTGIIIGSFLFKTAAPVHDQSEFDSDNLLEEVWTCSMHPQIRQEEPGDCPICGMELIPANQATENNERSFQVTEDAVKLANIQTTVVGLEGSTESGLRLNGKIKADETRAASLVTHIPGRIEKLYVSYTGEHVAEGQLIATIYSPDLITAQKELIEAQKIEAISPGLLEAAKNKLRYWKIGEQLIKEILDDSSIRETFDIYAEHSGVVEQKRVDVGDHLMTGQVLFDVQDLKKLWVLFDVYENDLHNVSVGQAISFTTPSAPGEVFETNISFINPVIDSQNRASTIRAEVSNKAGTLKPEMFVAGNLVVYQDTAALRVPKSAVLWTGKRSVVYVKVPGTHIPTFEYREIEWSDESQSEYSITRGLAVGEEVVTNGAFVIDASAQLNNQASMMNRNVTKKAAPQSPQLPDYTSTTPDAFKGQLTDLVNAYSLIKDALVEDNSKNTVNATGNFLSKAKEVDISLLNNKEHLYWMEQFTAMQMHGKKIAATENLMVQREQFDFLSQLLIESIEVFGVLQEVVYVQNCPMVGDNQGASWISLTEEIFNPYFGSRMLNCGEVLDTIIGWPTSSSIKEDLSPPADLHLH